MILHYHNNLNIIYVPMCFSIVNHEKPWPNKLLSQKLNAIVLYLHPSHAYSFISFAYTVGHIKGTRLSCLLYFYSYFDRRTQGLLYGLSYMNTEWGITFIVLDVHSWCWTKQWRCLRIAGTRLCWCFIF